MTELTAVIERVKAMAAHYARPDDDDYLIPDPYAEWDVLDRLPAFAADLQALISAVGEGWRDLPCHEQHALAEKIAANVGYVLVPEPSLDLELPPPPAGTTPVPSIQGEV